MKIGGNIEGKNMIKITKLLVLLTIGMVGMVGIATANPDPCPPPAQWNGKPASNDVLVLQEDLGSNLIKYYAKSATDKSPVGGIPGFQEVCIYDSSTGFTTLTALFPNWQVRSTNAGHIEFEGRGNPQNIPFDENIHEVGTVQWNAVPQNTKTLVHIISADVCGGYQANGEPKTCFARPPSPPGIVPELATIVLTSTGILGLVAISRRYKKN